VPLSGIVWFGDIRIVFPIIENQFKEPLIAAVPGHRAGGRRPSFCFQEFRKIGRVIAVSDVLQITVRRTAVCSAVLFVGFREINLLGIFALVAIDDDVSLIDMTFTD
jgi:hypothetical protein